MSNISQENDTNSSFHYIADTNIIYALIDKKDPLHYRAKQELSKLNESDKILLEDFIFIEIAENLQKKDLVYLEELLENLKQDLELSKQEHLQLLSNVQKKSVIINIMQIMLFKLNDIMIFSNNETQQIYLDALSRYAKSTGNDIHHDVFAAKAAKYPNKKFLSYNTLREYICYDETVGMNNIIPIRINALKRIKKLNSTQITKKEYHRAEKVFTRNDKNEKIILLPMTIIRLVEDITQIENERIEFARRKKGIKQIEGKSLIRHARMVNEYDKIYEIIKETTKYKNISIPSRNYMKKAFSLHDAVLCGLPDAIFIVKSCKQNYLLSLDDNLNKTYNRVKNGDNISGNKAYQGINAEKNYKIYNDLVKQGPEARKDSINTRMKINHVKDFGYESQNAIKESINKTKEK